MVYVSLALLLLCVVFGGVLVILDVQRKQDDPTGGDAFMALIVCGAGVIFTVAAALTIQAAGNNWPYWATFIVICVAASVTAAMLGSYTKRKWPGWACAVMMLVELIGSIYIVIAGVPI